MKQPPPNSLTPGRVHLGVRRHLAECDGYEGTRAVLGCEQRRFVLHTRLGHHGTRRMTCTTAATTGDSAHLINISLRTIPDLRAFVALGGEHGT